jgi:tetratricopeptide (TPR) repeat protein
MTRRPHLVLLAVAMLVLASIPLAALGQTAPAGASDPIRAADVAVKQGRLMEAERLYQQALKTREDADTLAKLSLVLIRQGRAEESAPFMRKALDTDPNSWTVVYSQARLLLARGAWDPAKSTLDDGAKARGRAEGEDDFLHAMALYNIGMKNDFEAEQTATRAMYLDPTDQEHIELVSRIYTSRGSTGLAITALEQTLPKVEVKRSAPMLTELGRLLQSQREFNDARDKYLAAMKADSNYVPALRDFGGLLKQTKQYKAAVNLYSRAVAQEPRDIDALVGLSEALLEVGQSDRAAKVAKDALAITTSRSDARRAYIRAGMRSSDVTTRNAAAAAFVNSAADTAWAADDWLALADMQRDADKIAEARQSVERAASLAPNSAQVPFRLGMIEISAGNHEAAVAQLQKAIEIKSDVPSYHLNLGIAYLAMNRKSDALAAMRRSVQVDPKYTTGRITLAQSLVAADSLAAADVQYQAVLAYEPKNAKALCGVGWHQLTSGDYSGAARSFRAAAESDPRNAEAWAGLGNALVGSQDLAKAEDALNKAKSIDSQNVTVKKGFELLERARAQSGRSN